jgi:probable F420-dependent oxidoreductase
VKFHVGLSTDRVDAGDEFVSADAIGEVARAAEAAGFTSVFVTEHPYPEDQWLATGGHHALDPFVALSFAAAATTTVRLFTNLCVLPYRNPFLAAKAAVTLDVLSGGRLTLGVGAGYLEPEFRALGVDFEERNDLLDEALVAIRRAWSEDGVRLRGRHFDVRGHTMLPRPAQSPHPPIWVGGNSKRAIRRAVDFADGWTPMPNPRTLGARRRSAHLETVDELRGLLAYADGYRAAAGHTGGFEVSVMPMGVAGPGMTEYEPARFRDHVAELDAIGVDGVVLMIPAGSRAQLVDRITEFGASTIEAASVRRA